MKKINIITILNGRIAQLVRAPALQAGGHRFKSCFAHFLLFFLSFFALNLFSNEIEISYSKKILFGDWSYYLKDGYGLKFDYSFYNYKKLNSSFNFELFSIKTYRDTYRLNFFNSGIGGSFLLFDKQNYRLSLNLSSGLSFVEKRDDDYTERGANEFINTSISFYYNIFDTMFGFSMGYLREKILYGKDSFTFDFNILFIKH